VSLAARVNVAELLKSLEASGRASDRNDNEPQMPSKLAASVIPPSRIKNCLVMKRNAGALHTLDPPRG